MAAAELSIPRRSRARSIGPAWLCAYAATWSVTLAGAGAVALAGNPLSLLTRRLLALTLDPRLTPTPTITHVVALLVHHVPIAAWPLLLTYAGADRSAGTRHAADLLVAGCIIANTVPVGAALGAYGVALFGYAPQLPVEWAGLSLGTASWLVQRRRPVAGRERVQWLALTVVLLLLAATLETFAVPHS